jgi:hypothetical protein
MTLTAFAALAALTLSPYPAVAGPGLPHGARPSHHRHRSAAFPESHRPQRGVKPDIPVADLYSTRAKRRMANYLRMRLAELRRARLDRAACVVAHRLPLDALFEP